MRGDKVGEDFHFEPFPRKGFQSKNMRFGKHHPINSTCWKGHDGKNKS